MNDLLSRSFGRDGPGSYMDLKKDSRNGEGGGDLELGPVKNSKPPRAPAAGIPDVDMTSFFDEVGVLKSEMEKIKQLLLKVQVAHEETRGVSKAQAMKALRSRMDGDIRQVTKLAKSIKLKLEDLDKANAESRCVRGCEEGTPTDRTRTAMASTLRKKLKDLMGEFQVLRQEMNEEYKETVERRYYTVTGEHADDETIDSIIETGSSETFLQKAIQEQGRKGQVLDTIREIQERHDAVKDIERHLLELHQIFMDMATLVDAQGEQLNDIEQQVGRASSFVMRGAQHLQVAKNTQRNSRKCCCIAVILLVILLLILAIPLLKSVDVL